ncbi:hypothetical protein S40293_07556 [Stachybotrys chartarum IBT 40293]|nr:hypothetical protein S40293_07556 [Stachybotrys chartarum IBT 40293]
MDSSAGTPPREHDDVSSWPSTKQGFNEAGDSQSLANVSTTLSPDAPGSKHTYASADPFSRLSISPGPSSRSSPVPHGPYHGAAGHTPTQQRPSRLALFWARNMPAILVALSQFFGALMNLSARLLELEGEGMHPAQILLVRQMLTSVACLTYMWWTRVPGFPFGQRDIRLLLLTRGFAGFFGIYGMWYSMMYLPLADATVITFLGPGVAGVICYFVLHEPFTRSEQLATLVALLGVVLIARPAALFGWAAEKASADAPQGSHNSPSPGADHESTAEERMIAVGAAMLGVLGAGTAFTTLRTIGKRAHALISVNFFAMICTLIAAGLLLFGPLLDVSQPLLRWRNPTSLWQCLLLVLSGIFGFIMQFLLTTGLGADKSNRANSMVYTHMLFAVAFDKWVFHHSMGLMSFAGCSLILGSAVSIVLSKRAPAPKGDDVERQANLVSDNEDSTMLMSTMPGNADEAPFDRGRSS